MSHIFCRWYTKVHLPLMFLSERRQIPWGPCIAGGKKHWWRLASRFCWNFYRKKDISNGLLWVFVALIIEHAKRMGRILLSSMNYQTLPCISFSLCYLYWHRYSHKLRICEKSYWAFHVCISFSNKFLWNVSNSEKLSENYIHKYAWFYTKNPIFPCNILKKLNISAKN